MNVTDQTSLASWIASMAHRGQFRRDGVTDAINHPMDVAERLKGESDSVIATGFLHDSVEDGGITLAELSCYDLSEEVLIAVDILTKRPGQDYTDTEYLSRVKQNPIARKVKIADMLSNLADYPTPKQIRKYAKGLLFLVDET